MPERSESQSSLPVVKPGSVAAPLHAGRDADRTAAPSRRRAQQWCKEQAAEIAILWDSKTSCAFAAFNIDVRPTGSELEAAASQLRMLMQLLASPADCDWGVQLRLIAGLRHSRAADDSQRPLAISLLCRTTAEKKARACRALRTLTDVIGVATGGLPEAYSVTPVGCQRSLKSIMYPFSFGEADIVEIQREEVTIQTASGSFSAPAMATPELTSGEWLKRALIAESQRLGQPVMWAVTLEPASDMPAARAAIDEAIIRLQNEYSEMVQAAAVQTGAGILRPSEEDVWRRLNQSLPDQWQLSGSFGCTVQAFLVSAPEVPSAVIGAAITEHSPPLAWSGSALPLAWSRPVRPKERRVALSAMASSRCVAWERTHDAELDTFAFQNEGLSPSRKRLDHASLARLFSVASASTLFRLPIPGSISTKPSDAGRKEVWLPENLEQTHQSLCLGDNAAHGKVKSVFVALDDRRRHVYCVGQTGTGKSTALLNFIYQDIMNGMGVTVLDPHGDLIERVLPLIPPARLEDVVIVDPSDRAMPVGFNFLDCADEDDQHQVTESFIGLLYQLFDPWRTGIIGPRFEHAVRNAMHTAMAHPGMTLVEVVRILTDDEFVSGLLPAVKDPLVRRYWTDQIAKTSDFHRSEVLDYIVSKFSPFTNNQLVRNIIGQSRSTFSLRQVMDEGKILLVNLAQGLLGQKLSNFLGMIFVPHMLNAALSRVAVPEEQRRDHSIVLDEFQAYTSPSFVDILSGARKYRLNMTMAHQHVGQLPADVRSAIFGNVGTMIAFRVGVEDAHLLSAAMQPSEFTANDFIELPNFRAISQILYQGQRTQAFSLHSRPVPTSPEDAAKRAAFVREVSRQRYGRPRAEVEREVMERAAL